MATKANQISGTMSGTGATTDDVIVTKRGRVKLEFAGVATVQLEEWSATADDFVPTGEVWTSSIVRVVDGGGNRMRLNCTAHTSNVVYELNAAS